MLEIPNPTIMDAIDEADAIARAQATPDTRASLDGINDPYWFTTGGQDYAGLVYWLTLNP